MRLTRSILAVSLCALSAGAFAQDKGAGNCAAKLKGAAPVQVKFTTSMGPITVELNKEKAPVSVANFASYVDSGHYAGTVFHRVIDGFMIQGGGFTKELTQKPTQNPIKNEAANGLKNDNYTIAMARTGVRDSATSQFYINVKDNDMLNYRGEDPSGWGYAVFGKVTSGQDTVDKIRKVATGSVPNAQGMPMANVPTTPVVIEKAECL